MRKYYLLVIASILISTKLLAQSQFTLYQLNSALPQANIVNAGILPSYKVTVGIPVFSSIYTSNDFGELSFNRIFNRDDNNSLYYDPQQLEGYLDENNHISLNAADQLIYLGLRLKKNFFSLSLTERVEGGISYPKSLVRLSYLGDGTGIGELFAFNELGIRAQVFHELAIGYGREFNNKLSIGIKAKFLSGIASVDAEKIGGSIAIGFDSLYLHTPAFNVNTAGTELFTDYEDIWQAVTEYIWQDATAFNNFGFAIDLGAHYRITEKLNVSLSLNDLGGIDWQNDTRQLQFPEVRYSFSGMDLVSAINNNEQDALFEQETDSLVNLYAPDSVEGIGYTTKLSPKFYAGASYTIGKLHTVGAMLYADVFKESFKPAFGFSYNLQLGHVWTIGVNASYRNQSFKNFGLGTTLTLGAFQIYVLTDNIAAAIHPTDARFVDLRFGLNLVFGKIKKTKKATKPKEVTPVIMPIENATDSTTLTLNEPVSSAIMGTAIDELDAGFYIVIASFSTIEESDKYSEQLQYEGYAALSGYQSERGKYYTYLMFSPDDGNKIIDKKNDLKDSFAPGLEIPWVLWVKDEQ